jgi:hypothetical protein
VKRALFLLLFVSGCGADIADEETSAKADLVGVWETTDANGEARRLSFANDKALVVATRTPGNLNGQRVGSVTVCSDTDYAIEGSVVVTDVRVGARTRRTFELTEGGTKLKIDYAPTAYVRIGDPAAKPITCSNVFPPDQAVR